eukprot:jgi/Chlat1/5444/Chrsp36S05415
MAEDAAKAAETTVEEEVPNGEVLATGCTDWANVNKPTVDTAKYPNLATPHRLAGLTGVQITNISAGCNATHCIATDVDGNCYTWGRNSNGQLGHGDTKHHNVPSVVEALRGKRIVGAAGGKAFTVVITDTGDSYSFGNNKHGQLGLGDTRKEVVTTPTKNLVTNATFVACGAEFATWLSSSGACITAGLPQYGQLGHGSDHEVNTSASSVKLIYEPQPKPKAIAAFKDKTITKVACGSNHSVAVDSNGHVYSWGAGGFGRLGHKDQKDILSPRQLETFTNRMVCDPEKAVVACGTTFSGVTTRAAGLFMWGLWKAGDASMYPKLPFMDLSGWNLRSMSCSKALYVSAEKSTISWGQGVVYGELGFGEGGKKSSARPEKITALEGMLTLKVAAGAGHALFLVDRTDNPDLNKMPLYEPAEAIVEENVSIEDGHDGEATAGKKRKADEAPGRGRGRGRGRGGKAGRGNGASAEPAPSARGRGRGRGRGKK